MCFLIVFSKMRILCGTFLILWGEIIVWNEFWYQNRVRNGVVEIEMRILTEHSYPLRQSSKHEVLSDEWK